MKAYTYQASDIGRADWPSGTLRLDGFEATADPHAADVFICPGPLLLSQDPAWLYLFPFMNGNEERHVFFDVSDHDTIYSRKNCILIRCNLKRHMLEAHPNSISWAWPVENMPECIDLPEGGFRYDVSGHMWTSTQTRIDAAQSCLNNPLLKCDIALYDDFTGYLKADDPELARRRAEFRRSMKESRIELCPESIPGVFPYRFFEAMSAGRVPLLVSSDYVLPWEESIPYSTFCIFVSREDAGRADQAALEFVNSHSGEQIRKMGLKARKYWERFLDCRKWPETMGAAVRAKLATMGVPCR